MMRASPIPIFDRESGRVDLNFVFPGGMTRRRDSKRETKKATRRGGFLTGENLSFRLIFW